MGVDRKLLQDASITAARNRGTNFLAMMFTVQLPLRNAQRLALVDWGGRVDLPVETGFHRGKKNAKNRGAYPKSGARIVRRHCSLPWAQSLELKLLFVQGINSTVPRFLAHASYCKGVTLQN